MTKKKIIVFIIGFYIFWLGLMPVLISETAKALCKNFSHNSNYKIELESFKTKLSILPIIRFEAKKIAVESRIDNSNLELDGVKVKLRLLPLLSGRVHLNKFNVDSFKMSSNIKENIELDKDFFSDLETSKFKCDSTKINSFEALVYQKETKKPIVFSGENFLLQLKNRYVSFRLNSTLKADDMVSNADFNLFLPKSNDINKTVFDIDIEKLDISPFRTYFKHYLPSDIVSLNGIINVHATKDELVTTLNDCSVMMKEQYLSMIFPKTMTIKSKFRITRQYVDFENIDIKSANIDSVIKGRISDYFGKTMPTLDFSVCLNKSKVEDIVSLLPPFKVEEIDVYKLKKYKFYGDAIGNFSLKGRLPEPELNGDIFVNNGILMKPIPNTSKGATIKLKFTGRYANFDVFVPAGGQEFVEVKGSQEIYNVKYADMTVKSSKNVDLHVAETVVNPLHEILNFIIGPVPIMDIYGRGNIDISVKGNRKNPHIWGVLNVNNSNVRFNEIPDLRLTDADAVLTFNDQDAVFITKKGLVNGKDFKIHGNCNLFGKFDFDVASDNQPLNALYKAIDTSTMIPYVKEMLPKLDKISGLADLNLKIYGAVKFIEDIEFNKNTFAKGEIRLKDGKFTLENVEAEKTNGILKVDGNNVEVDIVSSVSNSPMNIKAKVKNKIADVVLNIPRLNPNFIVDANDYLPFVSVDARYRGNVDNIEYTKLNFNAKVLESNPKSPFKFLSGEISASNNNLTVKNLKGYIDNNKNVFASDLRINNAFSNNPEINGKVSLKTPDLSLFNDLFKNKYLEFEKSPVDLNCKIFNNRINMFTNLDGISFKYLPLNIPVKILNGSVSVRNNSLRLNRINLMADSMPILVDGEVKDIFDKQSFNIYMNSKPKQDFIDKYFNKNQIYPIKIKGDIVYWIKLKGVRDNFELLSNVNMSKDSSIYHFGATVGDIENEIALYLDSRVLDGKNLKIKEFSYDRIIDSQSGKRTRMNLLKARGGVEIFKDDLAFKDLYIKTNNPTDARIFNIIFRKPNIKQGQFTSDLKINGKLSNPKVLGDFHIFETNIPFLDTTMKNIVLVFKDKVVEISSKGEVMGNELSFNGVLKNNLTLPYQIERAELYTKDLDLNYIVNKLKTSQVDNVSTFESFEGFDLNSILFNNFKLKADSIQLRNIHAVNFEAIANLNNKGLLDISNFNFHIANGTLDGKYKYDLKTNDMSLNLDAQDINANDITWALFDLNNQIYGDLTGGVNISCNGTDFNTCMSTLNGNTIFNVKNGKMPKLGSLEYLLKAGNLVKGGITGLSINSVIDLVAPSKIGEFDDIFGSIRIKDGVARNIEITTKGKDLSLFIGGTYNFATSIADMEVLGLLSRKISTMFGPIGNMSINTLFNVIPGVDLSKDSLVLERINKIPGIELSSKVYRRFIADIRGNINGEDYVTSFRWIN